MERALDADAPRLHEWGNVLRHVTVVHGDPDAEAEVWVEGYYETGMQDQAPLGPEAGIAIPAEDGGVDLIVTTQWLHVDRQQIAPCLNLPEERVRIVLAGVGGAFGSREDLHMQIHSCMLALHTGRPVKMSYGRPESFLAHVHRHPSRVWMRTGATRDGQLVNVRARVVIDGGAFASSSPAVIGNATTFAAGPYEVPNALLEGTAVYTNNPPCGAMRGFGAPQVCFAYEGQMDRLAGVLGIDPIELRLRNAVGAGSVLPTGQVLRGSAPVREVIERCTRIPLPPDPEPPAMRDPITFPGGAGNVGRGEGLKRGVGFALGFKNIAYSEGFDDFHEARVTLSAGPDGPVAEVHSAGVECGQGLSTVLAQVARTELGVERGQGDSHVMFAFAAQRAVVEVDEELGLVRVLQIASVLDVGKAINPQAVEGQSEGGTAQGLGLAVMEELQVRDGVIANPTFTDYLIPTTLDMPSVVTDIVEVPEPDVPYGAKGVGEGATIVTTAAVVAAIRDATGRALNRAPVRPDDIVGIRGPATSAVWAPSPDVPGPEPVPKYFGVDVVQSSLRGKEPR